MAPKNCAKTTPSAHSHKDQYGIQVKPATRVIEQGVFYNPSAASAAEKLQTRHISAFFRNIYAERCFAVEATILGVCEVTSGEHEPVLHKKLQCGQSAQEHKQAVSP